jgi:hypothetical protein
VNRGLLLALMASTMGPLAMPSLGPPATPTPPRPEPPPPPPPPAPPPPLPVVRAPEPARTIVGVDYARGYRASNQRKKARQRGFR